jgi:hypothetical protein
MNTRVDSGLSFLNSGRYHMRVLMKVSFPVERANASFKDGSFARKVQSILQDLKPEAVYFTTVGARRGGYVFLDLKDPSQIPVAAEPFFLAFNADIELFPAMTPEDLMKAGPEIEKAVKKYA